MQEEEVQFEEGSILCHVPRGGAGAVHAGMSCASLLYWQSDLVACWEASNGEAITLEEKGSYWQLPPIGFLSGAGSRARLRVVERGLLRGSSALSKDASELAERLWYRRSLFLA